MKTVQEQVKKVEPVTSPPPEMSLLEDRHIRWLFRDLM